MVYANALVDNPLDHSPKCTKQRHRNKSIDLLLATTARAFAALNTTINIKTRYSRGR